MGSSNTVCAKNTEKKLESQLKTIKLHRIITKVHKTICFTRTKISTPALFFDPPKKYFQSWQYSEKYCRNLCHFDVFSIISRHTAWLKDSEAVAPVASKEKLLLKIS